jgi:hypothetical protein
MNSVSEDIKDILTGYTFKTNLFISAQPPTPVNCVTLYDTGGTSPRGTFDKQTIYRDNLQVLVRDVSYLAGWDIAKDIADQLHNITGETKNGTKYILIELRSGIETFVQDDYTEFSVNFQITRQII